MNWISTCIRTASLLLFTLPSWFRASLSHRERVPTIARWAAGEGSSCAKLDSLIRRFAAPSPLGRRIHGVGFGAFPSSTYTYTRGLTAGVPLGGGGTGVPGGGANAGESGRPCPAMTATYCLLSNM